MRRSWNGRKKPYLRQEGHGSRPEDGREVVERVVGLRAPARHRAPRPLGRRALGRQVGEADGLHVRGEAEGPAPHRSHQDQGDVIAVRPLWAEETQS